MTKQRAGLSLIELLIVIAILALLIGLLLPAVQRVRESAARINCPNNLKQIGLAWHNYEIQNGFFPRAGGGVPQYKASGQPVATTGTWLWKILPFLEQEPLYLQSNAPTIADAMGRVCSTPVKGYFCPSRGRPQTFPVSGAEWLIPATYPRAGNDYAGNTGIPNHGKPGDHPNGAFAKGLSPTGFTDGLSCTLVAGERGMPVEWYAGQNEVNTWGYASSWDAAVSLGFEPYGPSQDLIGSVPQGYHDQWGSAHPVGMNALFGDGSVHVVPYTISNETMLRLCVRDDGQVVNFDWIP
jgi:prepilin-type N-terminal cleavage/methylation domain-containing protein/prepilin-type processing-associated H-X9-DG protein